MNWNSVSEFIAMGGYGGYVWGSFGVVFALMAAEVVLVGQRWRAIGAQLRRTNATMRRLGKGQA